MMNKPTLKVMLILSFLIANYSCEKESTDEIITQEKFNAPSIELAKQYVNSNNNTSNPNISFRNSSSDQISVTHWEGSKTKIYKDTEEQNVDILYTPIYVNSPRTDIKGFIASTEKNGIVDSRKFYILYKSNDLENGLNAYILIYGLDGNLQQAYNYENGQQIPLPERNDDNTLNRSSSECDNDISAMSDEEFENWWVNCSTGVALNDPALVTATTFSNDGGNNNGSTSAFNDWNSNNWVSVHIPAVTDPGSNYNSGNINDNNTDWHTPNVIVANAPSIAAVLDAAYNSAIANWLREMEQTNQQILNQIADYLNANREQNPLSDFTFNNIQPEQFPVSDEAIEFISQLINIGVGNFNFEQDYKNRMSVSETQIFESMSRFNQLGYLANAQKATWKSEELFPNSLYNGKGDAFRHAYWNALNVILLGYNLADSLTTAHEDQPSSYSYSHKEKQMDLFNNEVGRNRSSWFLDGYASLEESILNALNTGLLKYLNNLAFNGRATANSQLIPTNQ